MYYVRSLRSGWPLPILQFHAFLSFCVFSLPQPSSLLFILETQFSPNTKLCSAPSFTPYLVISSSTLSSQFQHLSSSWMLSSSIQAFRQSLPCVFLPHSHSRFVPCSPLLSLCFDLIAPVSLLWLLSMASPKDYQHKLLIT